MSRAYLFVAVCAVSLLAVVLLSLLERPHVAPVVHDEETVVVVPAEQVGAATSSVTLSAPHDARAPESIELATAEDPCAALVAQLATTLAQLERDRSSIDALRAELVHVRLELDRMRFDEATPYGAFLRSDESSTITDARVFVAIEDWLRQFPVFLGQGEATWIAERTSAGDWALFGPTSEIALIQFLGARRLAAELPPERVAELRVYYADQPGVFP